MGENTSGVGYYALGTNGGQHLDVHGHFARLADMAQPGDALPPSQSPRKTEAPEPNALRDDAVVAKWLAGGDFGSAVSYACQSAEHRAQVNRLRATLK